MGADGIDHHSCFQICRWRSRGWRSTRHRRQHRLFYDRAGPKFWRSIVIPSWRSAGVPATAWGKWPRVLEHSFQFFRRTQLQEMSVDGKSARALSEIVTRQFLGFRDSGHRNGSVPIFATYDSVARLYFYDAMGAQFEVTEYAATGSGSPAVRRDPALRKSVGKKSRCKNCTKTEAVPRSRFVRSILRPSPDTATGGVDRSGKIFPIIKIVSGDGITTLPERKIGRASSRKPFA